jgi:hypothetical protein
MDEEDGQDISSHSALIVIPAEVYEVMSKTSLAYPLHPVHPCSR